MRPVLKVIEPDNALVQQLAGGDYLRAGPIEPMRKQTQTGNETDEELNETLGVLRHA